MFMFRVDTYNYCTDSSGAVGPFEPGTAAAGMHAADLTQAKRRPRCRIDRAHLCAGLADEMAGGAVRRPAATNT